MRSLGAAGTDCPMEPLWSWCSVWVVRGFSFSGPGRVMLVVRSLCQSQSSLGRYFKAKVDSHSQSKRGCQGNDVAPSHSNLLCTWSVVLMHCPHLLQSSALELSLAWLTLLHVEQAAALQGWAACGEGVPRHCLSSSVSDTAVPWVPPSLSPHPARLLLVLKLQT